MNIISNRNELGETNSGGIGIAGALGLLFIGLKLGGVITWSWLWVLAPFWIPLLFVLLVLGAVAIGAAFLK